MINLDKTKVQQALKLQLITLLSDTTVKITSITINNELMELPSTDGWKQWEKSPITDISLKIYREKTCK